MRIPRDHLRVRPHGLTSLSPPFTVLIHGLSTRQRRQASIRPRHRLYTIHGAYIQPSTIATMSSSRRTSNPSALRVQAWAEDIPAVGIVPEKAMGPAAISTTLPIRPVAATARSDAIRGTAVTLSIPLDEVSAPKPVRPSEPLEGEDGKTSYVPRRKVLRRDSMERREALLKGKEGSRRRQRWENGE